MNRNAIKVRSIGCFALVGIVAFAGRGIEAAELRLKGEVQSEKALMVLGDVAEVFAADPQEAQRLSAIELMPAPTQGQKLSIPLRDLQDLLAIRGVNLTECQFSGAATISVVAAAAAASPAKSQVRRPAKILVQQARHLAEEAIARYLRSCDAGSNDASTNDQASASPAAAETDWLVHVDLDDQQAATIAATADTVTAEGGHEPFLGNQEFALTVPTAARTVRVAVAARVSLPPSIVATIRPISKGSFVRACDVQLQRLKAGQTPGPMFQTIADVVGKEAIRGLPAGQPLDPNLIRAPLLVSAGEVVTVLGRNAGIVVRMPARARDNGSRGDLVTVESLLDRRTFLARVTELHEVEVFAGASTTSPEAHYTASAQSAAPPARRVVRQVAAAAE